jgi:hypothetical protein
MKAIAGQGHIDLAIYLFARVDLEADFITQLVLSGYDHERLLGAVMQIRRSQPDAQLRDIVYGGLASRSMPLRDVQSDPRFQRVRNTALAHTLIARQVWRAKEVPLAVVNGMVLLKPHLDGKLAATMRTMRPA